MAHKDFGAVKYIPYLELRPAEMVALEELPERDKDLMLPLFKLRPWVGSNTIDKSIDKIKEVYGTRPCLLMLSDEDGAVERRRPVHDTLDTLRNASNGFDAWCKFIEDTGNEQFIPYLQLSNPSEFDVQLKRLFALRRGVVVVVQLRELPFLREIAARTSLGTSGGDGVVFLLDFGRKGQGFLMEGHIVLNYVKEVAKALPLAKISVSSSTFPDSFVSVIEQTIFERKLFNWLIGEFGGLIYSDHGSARVERQTGGGGQPNARIDYATGDNWFFFRDNVGGPDRESAYKEQAKNAINSSQWDPKLHLWGTQMILRTALGDPMAITSPARSTAVRINIHLHQQLYYGDPAGLVDTEEEWSD